MVSLNEIGFKLTVRSDISQEEIDVLRYMTRSEDYEFETTIKHPAFDKWDGWTWIISNLFWESELESLDGPGGSKFQDNQLVVRRMFNTCGDEFVSWYELANWLGSISAETGLIGYHTGWHSEDSLVYTDGNEIDMRSDNSVLFYQLVDEITQLLA
jgi:hypothetical protein